MKELDDFLEHTERQGLKSEAQLAEETSPWHVTANYGRADLTLHPLVREAYKVACLIERCGASEDLTRASSAAFALCESLSDFMIAYKEVEELVSQFDDGHTQPEGYADSAGDQRK